MKKITFTMTVLLTILLACSTNKTEMLLSDFEVCEIVLSSEIPSSIIDSLSYLNIIPENNSEMQNFGYLAISDSSALNGAIKFDSIEIMKSTFRVGDNEKYFALYALKNQLKIPVSEIQNSSVKDGSTEIHFKMKGTQKWAEYTEAHTGKHIAFIKNRRVQDVVLINGKINIGVAIINNRK
ncbi:MAG: hypothetical protein JXA77_03095 [Bacteroidales bacterium]|nr:hypothetical protein [Bacteroidales bacterium]MBN2817512.1 hypothetical protein [Bacteroidales bacterium]